MLLGLMPRSLWLSNKLFYKLRELNLLLLKHESRDSGLVEFGKIHYHAIAELRSDIEQLNAKDLLALHDVKKFLRAKKASVGYTAINP